MERRRHLVSDHWLWHPRCRRYGAAVSLHRSAPLGISAPDLRRQRDGDRADLDWYDVGVPRPVSIRRPTRPSGVGLAQAPNTVFDLFRRNLCRWILHPSNAPHARLWIELLRAPI